LKKIKGSEGGRKRRQGESRSKLRLKEECSKKRHFAQGGGGGGKGEKRELKKKS